MFCCFRVKSFCCMDLYTAGVVIGWLSGGWAAIKQVVLVTALGNAREIIGSMSYDYGDQIVAYAYMGISICLTFSVLDVIASGLLIAGVKKNSHVYLLPWLINNGILIALQLHIFVAVVWACSSCFTFLLFLLIFNYFGLMGYIWVAVFSLYDMMRGDKDPDTRDSNGYSSLNAEDGDNKRS